jgi:hypothetical protein
MAQTESSARVKLPESFNYIGAFLTFRCPYACSYCINRMRPGQLAVEERSAAEWLQFFERLDAREIPVTFQGGEPGLHRDFLTIVRETLRFHPVDILTNLAFDLGQFVDRIDPNAINRPAPYAPIRVSFHPEQFSLEHILDRVLFVQRAGFRVGLYGVTHPANAVAIDAARARCKDLGVDFRTKPFLGWDKGALHGEYAYSDACGMDVPRSCECAASEALIAPNGRVFRCHHHLYGQVDPLGVISDPDLAIDDGFHPCAYYGHCNPCDVKLKNNRFQQFGHVSVRIRFPWLERKIERLPLSAG